MDVDVSRAKPWWVRAAGPRGGKFTLSELVSKYDPIVSGKAAAVSLPDSEAKKYKKLGYETTASGRVIIPHAATEKVRVTRGKVQIKDVIGISRTPIPVEYHNLEQYLRDLRAKDPEITKMKAKGKYFAFRFYGGHSSRVYSDLDLLLDDLQSYEEVEESIDSHSARDMNEVYRNLEIVTVSKIAWAKSVSKANASKKKRGRHKSGSRKRKLEKLKAGPAWKLNAYRKKRAEESRRQRAKLQGAKKKEYQKDAIRRAKKSLKKLKG